MLPHAVPSCANGICEIANCLAGYGDCDGLPDNGCEQSLDTLRSCGMCGQRCERTGCAGGQCTAADCAGARADCDGDQTSCEVDLTDDPEHCGSCGNRCAFSGATEAHARLGCESATCRAVCDPGWGDCDGNYTNGCEQMLTTLNHCGACQKTCAIEHATATCQDGHCAVQACEAGFGDCDRDPATCETSLDSLRSCGACDNACDSDQTCSDGPGMRMCSVATCMPGFEDCDGDMANGCERDTRAPALGGQGPCKPDSNCNRYTWDDHSYFFCARFTTWDSARMYCQSQLGGDLAHIESGAERDFLRTHLKTRNWIGHTDVATEGLWVWAYNGVPFWRGGRSGSPIHNRFAGWAAGEPNGSGNCGAIYADGGLDDLECERPQPFICEVSPDGCPADPLKNDPGQCGCGVSDTDSNGDGVADCP